MGKRLLFTYKEKARAYTERRARLLQNILEEEEEGGEKYILHPSSASLPH